MAASMWAQSSFRDFDSREFARERERERQRERERERESCLSWYRVSPLLTSEMMEGHVDQVSLCPRLVVVDRAVTEQLSPVDTQWLLTQAGEG